MSNELFNADLLAYAQVFSTITAPLGDYAPRCRLLSVDYKNRDGVDCSQDIAVGQNRDMTDECLVELIQEQYARMRFSVSAITEVVVNGTPRVLYIRPGFIEESMIENGLTMPQDIAAALTAAGVHPVNWEELVHGS